MHSNFFWLSISCFLMFACAQNQKGIVEPREIEVADSEMAIPELQQKADNLSHSAEYYFGLGEYSFYEDRYRDAYYFYLNASLFDNHSEMIEEKLVLSIFKTIYLDKDFFKNWNELSNLYSLPLNSKSSLNYLSGIFNYLDGNYTLAARYLVKDIVDDRDKSKGLYNFVLGLLHDVGMREQEIAIAQMAYNKYPDNLDFANWYAYTIVINDKTEYFPFAFSLLEKCVQGAPNNVYYWDSMVWLYYKWGKQEKAYELAKKYLVGEAVLQEAEMTLHLGFIYLGQGLLDESVEYFRKVLLLDKGEFAIQAEEELKNLLTGDSE